MSTNESRGPFSRRGFVAAAVVIGLVVLAALVVIVSSIGHDSNGPRSIPQKSLSSSPPLVTKGDKSICGLAGFDKTDSLSSPPATHWTLVGTVAAPTAAETAGPGRIRNGLRTCYAHTAEGALFMAANFIAMGSDATLGPRLIDLVAPGAGRDALAGKPSSSSTASSAQVAGYKIGNYTSSGATVEIVMDYSDGSLVSIPLKLAWIEGDWKVVLTDAGTFPLAPAQIQNLGGYTPWSGA